MIELSNEFCNVKIDSDDSYVIKSADNKKYDFELNLDGYTGDDFYRVFSISIDLFDRKYTIALVGNVQSSPDECAFLDGNILTVMQNHTILQIDVRDARVILHKSFDCFGCTFSIFRVIGGYIVHGELEIVRLDERFNKVWSFSGCDIFYSYTGKNPFELCEDKIKLYDWLDNYYELDYDGKVIREVPSKR